MVSVASKAYSVRLSVRMFNASSSPPCWKIRHRLRLSVVQESDVLLVHKGEVVLEVEMELEHGPLIVVVLDVLRSKLRDFCNVRHLVSLRRHHAQVLNAQRHD